MEWISKAFYHAGAMLWEMLWALVLGFIISAVLQVYVRKERIVGLFGRNRLQDVFLAMSFGAASSSCSYAAAATTKTVFKKGAAFLPSLAFMIASTNLVVELGIVLYLLMGWQFVTAEFLGAFVMVCVVWLLFAVHPPRKLIAGARKHKEKKEMGGHRPESSSNQSKQVLIANAFIMEGSMLWKEIIIGVVLAGFLSVLVPKGWWQAVFISHGSHSWRLLENACLGPLIALASFVCSVGNIPLASLLWSSGATFGGVIAFLYGDLIVLPLIFAYRKYYGLLAAIYITALLYAGMVVAGVAVDLAFTAIGLVPQAVRAEPAMLLASFSWNYTTWLNLIAIIGASFLAFLHFTHRDEEAMGDPHEQEGRGHHAH